MRKKNIEIPALVVAVAIPSGEGERGLIDRRFVAVGPVVHCTCGRVRIKCCWITYGTAAVVKLRNHSDAGEKERDPKVPLNFRRRLPTRSPNDRVMLTVLRSGRRRNLISAEFGKPRISGTRKPQISTTGNPVPGYRITSIFVGESAHFTDPFVDFFFFVCFITH